MEKFFSGLSAKAKAFYLDQRREAAAMQSLAPSNMESGPTLVALDGSAAAITLAMQPLRPVINRELSPPLYIIRQDA